MSGQKVTCKGVLSISCTCMYMSLFSLDLSLSFFSFSHFCFPSSLRPSFPSFSLYPSFSLFSRFLPLPFTLPPSTPPSPPSLPFLPSLPTLPFHTDYTSNTNGNNADSELWKRAKLLAHRVQSVCITEHLPIVPKRLVVTNVIHTLLVSLVDSVKQCDRFLNSDLSLEPEGLK